MAVRSRGGEDLGIMRVAEFAELLTQDVDRRGRVHLKEKAGE